VNWTVATDLIGDVNVAALGVFCHWRHGCSRQNLRRLLPKTTARASNTGACMQASATDRVKGAAPEAFWFAFRLNPPRLHHHAKAAARRPFGDRARVRESGSTSDERQERGVRLSSRNGATPLRIFNA